MNQPEDPRTEELNNLKLALATFALRLDAFEARMRSLQPKAKPVIPAGPASEKPAPGDNIEK